MKKPFKYRFKRRLKRITKWTILIVAYVGIFFGFLYLVVNKGILWVIPFPFVWLLVCISIAEKFGFMRRIRTEKEIKFHQEHQYLYTKSQYRDDDIKVYRNKRTHKIIEK
jgi:hypothetical protein